MLIYDATVKTYKTLDKQLENKIKFLMHVIYIVGKAMQIIEVIVKGVKKVCVVLFYYYEVQTHGTVMIPSNIAFNSINIASLAQL